MAKKEATKDIAVIDVNNYPMLLELSEANAVIEAVRENFEGSIPHPRNLFTQIPNMRGEEQWMGVETEDGLESFKELTGVILYIGSNRALFEGKWGEGRNIPLCSSDDGIYGVGDPGGECTNCEYSKFGENGQKPRCEQKRPMYVLIPEISPILPVMFNVPATNFTALNKYKAQLSRYGNKLFDVETRFTLKKSNTQGGMTTSLLQLKMLSNIRKTDPETHKKIIEFRKNLLPYMMPETIKVPEEAIA